MSVEQPYKNCPHCNGPLDVNRVIEWGGWSFDEMAGNFVPGTHGDKINFTKTEARVIGCILRLHGAPAECDGAIYAAICGNRPDQDWPELKIVVVIISKIRQKMKKHNLLLIETSWGRGYRAVPYSDSPSFYVKSDRARRIPWYKSTIGKTSKACECNHAKSHHHSYGGYPNKIQRECLVIGCKCKEYHGAR